MRLLYLLLLIIFAGIVFSGSIEEIDSDDEITDEEFAKWSSMSLPDEEDDAEFAKWEKMSISEIDAEIAKLDALVAQQAEKMQKDAQGQLDKDDNKELPLVLARRQLGQKKSKSPTNNASPSNAKLTKKDKILKLIKAKAFLKKAKQFGNKAAKLGKKAAKGIWKGLKYLWNDLKSGETKSRQSTDSTESLKGNISQPKTTAKPSSSCKMTLSWLMHLLVGLSSAVVLVL